MEIYSDNDLLIDFHSQLIHLQTSRFTIRLKFKFCYSLYKIRNETAPPRHHSPTPDALAVNAYNGEHK